MSDLFFDEDSRPIAAVDFQFPQDEPEDREPGTLTDDDADRLRMETIQRTLQYLLKNAHDPAIVGERAILLGFLIGTGPRTQRELAKLLGFSDGRISQKLKEMRRVRL
jgi:hypothetical protein